jgi:hypothetical protein
MLPAILAVDMPGFGERKEKVWYKLVKAESKELQAQFAGAEYYFELKNESGLEVATTAELKIFWLYRVK